MKRILFTCIIALLFVTDVTFSQTVGQAAPDFTLTSLENEEYTLSENKGDVILIFLVGNSCPYCIASAPLVNSKIIAEYKDNPNFQVLVIDTWNGSASVFTNFKNTTGLEATYLLDGSTVAQKWATTYDRLMVVDAEGILVYKGSRAAKSDVDDAADAVAEALSTISTGIGDLDVVSRLSLAQNYPNPASGLTHIDFDLPSATQVKLSIIDLTGKTIEEVSKHEYSSGAHRVTLNVSDYKRGIYFYRLEANGSAIVKRMVVN